MGMSVWLWMSRTFSSATVLVSKRRNTAFTGGGHTFLVVGLLEPSGAEELLREDVIPALDDQRLAPDDDVEQDELLELESTEVPNLCS